MYSCNMAALEYPFYDRPCLAGLAAHKKFMLSKHRVFVTNTNCLRSIEVAVRG